MTDEPVEATPGTPPPEAVLEATETPAEAPVVNDAPVSALDPVAAPEGVVDTLVLDEEPPADPIITDPVLVDAPVDSVFNVPIEQLDTAAATVLETMPDAEKEVLQTFITTNYWGAYEHFECAFPNCQRDFLSEADMVSHLATEHRPEDADTPIGQRAVYDRFGNLVSYEDI